MSLKKAVGIIVLILLIDQISKIYIKTHFQLQEQIVVFDWFRILFVENEGMAWGAKIPGNYGKIILTLFRIGILPLIVIEKSSLFIIPAMLTGIWMQFYAIRSPGFDDYK